MTAFTQTVDDVNDEQQAVAAAGKLAQAQALAVDVEADAMHAFRARLCFVQVGTDEGVFLFDTLSPGVRADVLARSFADPAVTKFFHAAGGDLQYLAEAGVRVAGLFDTHRAATLLGWPKVGLADLALERLGVQMDKAHQQSDFAVRPLPPGMRDYIADDVRYLVEIGRQVRAECEKADILEEVLLDCQRMCDEATERPDQAGACPKVPGGGLSQSQALLARAIAQSLHERRLVWAEAANVPMGRMLSNAAILALSARPPQGLKELSRTQGVRGPFVREHGEEVLSLLRSLIERSRNNELPADTKDREPKNPKKKKREEALKVFRAAKALERKVTGSAVLPNALIEELARLAPASHDELAALPYLGPKRLRLYGNELLELIRDV